VFVKLRVSGFLSSCVSTGASSLAAGCGAKVSMYLGVKSNTMAIKKKAIRVFLSMLSYRVVSTLTKGVTPSNPF